MSRGWESKDVASRQEEFFEKKKTSSITPAELDMNARVHGLELDQKRMEREFAVAKHPRHKEMIKAALAHVLEKLAKVKGESG